MHLNYQKLSLYAQIILYILAGINHFVHPGSYVKIIPPYLPAHPILNTLAGIAEISGGILLCFASTRSFAAWGIILMLVAFIPVHIYMIQTATSKAGTVTPEQIVLWIRLPLQLLLIAWAYHFTGRRTDQLHK